MEILRKFLLHVLQDNKKKTRWRVFATTMAAIIVFATTYSLILPAITMDSETAETMAGFDAYLLDDEEYSDQSSDSDYSQDILTDESYEADIFGEEDGGFDFDSIFGDEDDFSADNYYTGEESDILYDEIQDASGAVSEITYTDEQMEACVKGTEGTAGEIVVQLSYDATAWIPDGAELVPCEIDSNSWLYSQCQSGSDRLQWQLPAGSENYAFTSRFFQFNLLYEEEAVVPANTVHTKIIFADPIEGEEFRAVQFIQTNATDFSEGGNAVPYSIENVQFERDDDGALRSVSFETDRMSVVGVQAGVLKETEPEMVSFVEETVTEGPSETTPEIETEEKFETGAEEETDVPANITEDEDVESKDIAENEERENITEADAEERENITEADAEERENITEADAEERENITEAELEDLEVITEAETEELEDITEAETEEFEDITEAETEEETEISYPAQDFDVATDTVTVKVYAPEGAFPDGTTMSVEDVEDKETLDAIENETTDEKTVVKQINAVDITFRNAEGEEIEPLLPIRVEMTPVEVPTADAAVVVHVDKSGNAETVETVEPGTQMLSAAEYSTYPQDTGTESDLFLLENAGDIKEESVIPGAVSETLSQSESFPVNENTVAFDASAFSVYALVYTVDFYFEYNGKAFLFTLNGADAVSLSRLAEVLGIAECYVKDQDNVNAGNDTGTGESTDNSTSEKTDEDSWTEVFMQDDSVSENESSGMQNETGETASVTADEIIGDEIEISEKTKQFLEQVETVTFSDPELLWTGQIEEDTTTGSLIYQYDLVPEYPCGMTANEYGDYAAREFSAPDWVLISLRPFDTEEVLTINMKNGDVITVAVTDDADAVMIDDGAGGRVVQTIANPAGTTIDLFDYWITDNLRNSEGMNGWPGHRGDAFSSWQFDHYNYYGQQQNTAVPMSQDSDRNNDWYVNSGSLRGNGNNQGINNGHVFKFYPGAAGTVVDRGRKGNHTDWTNNHDKYTSINSWTGDADPTTGLIVGYLVNGYPQLTNNSNLGTDGSSLAYLFNSNSHSGKQKYGEVNNLLYVDSEGYYTYDSRYYSAAYDPAQGDGGNFVLREHASNAANEVKGFWPFGSRVNWHGMHMNTQFSMPTNGQVLNPNGDYKDMQFAFSGDDDTWLYIDGILVGDGGGIHNRTEIDINFATGVVIVTGTEDDNHQGTFTSQTTLRAIFEAAEQSGRIPSGYVAQNFEAGSNTFKAGTYHTFDMFYLERGGSESNLYIRYNLVSTADFTAHKSYHSKDGSRLERDEFKFELIGLDGRYESVPAGTDDQGNTIYRLVEASWSNDTYSLPQNNRAVMPNHNAAATAGAGTVASPYYDPNDTERLSNGSSVSAQLYRTGVSEDGNVNFGQAEISEAEKYAKNAGHASVYRYIIREYVPADAVNADGIKWSEASDEAKLEGGFTLGDVTYDGTIYYMTARVTSWEETNATGQTVTRYGLSKTYYTDDTYTTVKEDINFASFVNGYVQPLTLKVVKKSDSGKLLNGATFTLTHAMQNEAGKWVPRQYIKNDVTITAATRTGTTSQGVLTFDNLTEGHYILEETVAPAGYEKGSPSKWLVTLTKEDTASRIVLEPSIRPLNADGLLQEGVEPTVLTVENDNTFEYEVLNGKIPRGDIEVTKKWLRADGTTAYTAEEIAQLGDDVQNTTITGELWRRYHADVTAEHPTVTIYAKLNNQSNYTQKWQGQIEYGSDVLYSMAVNGTGYPLTQTVSTGAVPVAAPDQNITYDNGINKPSGHVYALQNVTVDTQIYADFDSSKANNSGIGFYLVSKVDPSSQSHTTQDLHTEKVSDFTLNYDNGWTVIWTSADLAEHDYDYEYYFQNVTESALEDFTFVGTPEAVTDSATGKVTYSYKNISKGEQTDLTVRKIWTDGNDSHTGDTISYKIQRTEYDLSGTQETEPYDYIVSGQTSAQVYTLSSSDLYNGVSWQKHHDSLPADNGKAETDPDYRRYRYSVVEIVPEGYAVAYSSLTDTYEESSYEVKLLRNTPTEHNVGVEKKWMDAEQSAELTDEIPEGVYITGTLKRDYTHIEPSGATVNVYFRSWSDGSANPVQLYRSYTDVRQGTVFSVWAVDADGIEPIHGVTVNDRQLEQSGEAKTFSGSGWEKTTNAFVTEVSGNTEIILEWYDNTAYQTAVYYDVSYTQETGSGQAQSGTETVGTFRLDALNNWTRMWTDRTLNEAADRNYAYYITDIQEYKADGTVVDHYDGFQSPSGGVMTYNPGTQMWSAVIVNALEPEEVPIKIRKLKEGTQIPLSGALFTLTQVDRNGNNVAGGIVRGPSPTDENGELTFDGIVPGRYKLAETPPAGYVKVEGDYFINITAGGGDIIEGEPLYIDYELSDDDTHLYTVENLPGAALPNTGGPGTRLTYLIGLMMSAFAGAGLVMRRRRRRRVKDWVNW